VKYEVAKKHRTFIVEEVQILKKEAIDSKYFEVLHRGCRSLQEKQNSKEIGRDEIILKPITDMNIENINI
jgi:hypothetical protein